MRRMIFTTYFSKIKSLPERVVPIAICGGIPDWYKGLWYKKLAPSWSIFSEWKNSKQTPEDINRYIDRYKSEVIGKLDVYDVHNELFHLLVENKFDINSDIALVCYEKFGSFCHRHIVSEWIRNKDHIPCVEFNFDEVIPDCVFKYIQSIKAWEDGHVISNDPYEVNFAPYAMESYRSDCHYDMLEYYDLSSEIYNAKTWTSEYSMYKDEAFSGGMKYGSQYLKDKDIIARDFHSILMHCKYLEDNPDFKYGH